MPLATFPDLSRRALIPELMDDPAVDVHGLFPALRFLEMVNGMPGGAGLVLAKLLEERARWQPGATLTVVDVGTGAADVPRALVAALCRLGQSVHATGVDLHERTLSYALQRLTRGVSLVRGDALALPFGDGTVDYALSTTFLHHLDDVQARQCLSEMKRVARRGVIVVDLERTLAAWIGIKLATLLSNRIARHDGPVSVQRSYLPHELLELAGEAGLPQPRVSRHVPFRQALVSFW